MKEEGIEKDKIEKADHNLLYPARLRPESWSEHCPLGRRASKQELCLRSSK